MTKIIRITVRLDVVSFGVLTGMQRRAGGSRAEALRRVIRKGSIAPTGSIAPLTSSASFRLSEPEQAELIALASKHKMNPAELIRRMLRANAQDVWL